MNIKQLTETYHEFKYKDSSIAKSHGLDYCAKTKFTDTSEKGLKECIRAFCEMDGKAYFSSTPNKSFQVGEKKTSKSSTLEIISGIGKVSLKPIFGYSSGTNGMSDMHGHIDGKAVFLEIKIPGDTQQDNQIEFEAEINRTGAIYIIVKDFQDFYSKFNQIRQTT